MSEIQKILKPSKIVIFVDSRESPEVIKNLSNYDCKVINKQLLVGDYLCSSSVCVERKSLAGDVPVIVKVDGKIKVVPIEKAYSFFQNGSTIEVMGVNFSTHTVGWFEVYDMTSHDSDSLLGISFSPKIKKKYENEKNISIKVTDGHNVYIIRKKRIMCLPTSQLKRGDNLLLVPPKLPEEKSSPFSSFEKYISAVQSNSSKGVKIGKTEFKLNSSSHGFKIPVFNEDFFFLLGLWVADGCLKKGGVGFTQKDENRNEVIETLLNKVFGNFKENSGEYTCGGKLYKKLFLDIFEKSGAENKHVPSLVFTAPKPLKTAFIRGYFFGDGWKNEKKRINPQLQVCSKSKELIAGISYLLYSLGIENSVTFDFIWYKGLRRKYYKLSIKTKSLNKFLRTVGQIPTKEIKVRKTNSREIPYSARLNFYKPLLTLTKKEIDELYEFMIILRKLYTYTKSYVEELKDLLKYYHTKKEFSKKYGINYSTLRNITNGYAKSSNLFLKLVNIIRSENELKPMKINFKKLRKLLRKLNVSTYLTRFEKRNFNIETIIKNVYEAIEKKVGFDSIFLLAKIYNGEIFMRKISSIEKIKGKNKVFDFSVKGAENFVGGLEPILVHNTAEDFVNSIIDGRLFEQAEELKDNFSKPILLIEGNRSREGMNENAIKSALASIILDFDIPIIMTRDEEETARMIYWLAKREQTISKKGIGIKGKKKPKKMKDLQEYIISGFPGVSVVLSKRILKKFKTIKNFAKATEKELTEVDGIGKVLAKRLHELLNEEYGGKA